MFDFNDPKVKRSRIDDNLGVLYKKVIVSAYAQDGGQGVCLSFEDGSSLELAHEQDCCESVRLESSDVDPSLFVGGVVLSLEKRTVWPAAGEEPEYEEMILWTFYTLTTTKGACVFRFVGNSNGFYSVAVDAYLCTSAVDVVRKSTLADYMDDDIHKYFGFEVP